MSGRLIDRTRRAEGVGVLVKGTGEARPGGWWKPSPGAEEGAISNQRQLAIVGVRLEFDLNAVEFEVTDQDGKGFRTLLGSRR